MGNVLERTKQEHGRRCVGRCVDMIPIPPFLSFVVVCQDDAPCPHGGCRPSASRDPTREPAGGYIFEDGDHDIYRDLLAEQTRRAGVEVWAYCLMPNHVHLILTPTRADSLGLAVGERRGRYSDFIDARGRWTGHLFQSRFASRGHGRGTFNGSGLLCEPKSRASTPGATR